MDFLKELFNSGVLTWEQFSKAVSDKGFKIVDLSKGEYVSKSKSVTAAPTAIGTVTVTLLKDGVAVPGATASATVAAIGDNVTLPINALVRLQCCDDSSTLTLALTGTASVINNAAVVVEKL